MIKKLKEKKGLLIALLVVLILLLGFILYYITLPAINIHSVGFWVFIAFIISIIIAVYASTHIGNTNKKVLKGGIGFLGAIIVIFIIGAILSSPIVNAKKYQKIIDVQTANFTDDIKEISYDKIPLLDRDSATRLGSRTMGTMVDIVSQFEVSEYYTQINYKSIPVRVSPLKYGSLIKWFTNKNSGIPAYILIDMTTQNAECIRLDQGMRYSTFDHFSRNLYRHLRFAFPTYIFDDVNFEINDDGTPYWICPVKRFSIGLFGGETIGRVVLVNAVTGQMENYSVDEVPSWVDHVYSASMLISHYDYYGGLINGYFNSVLSKKGCLQTTNGYNYIALNDDIWVYTGVTSVGADESNVGFVLMNQRTQETKYYEIAGAQEESAMRSAEGQVQNLGYVATFPLLLNIGGEPTYFMALKDDAGLVKKYAMVNIRRYQNVAIGDTVQSCEKAYTSLLESTGITTTDMTNITSITGTIAKIAQGVVGGNSHYYIMLNESDIIFDVSVLEHINIIKYNIGDPITFQYSLGVDMSTVIDIQ